MEIKAVTKYKFDGKEYSSLKEIQDFVHNVIGEEVLDKITRVAPPQKHADYIKILEVLCNPDVRNTLMKCYTITYEEEDEDYNTTFTNILDI